MGKKLKKAKSLIVTVSDDGLKDIQQVADQLSAKGMKVKEVMPMTGVIVGSSTASKMTDLKKVHGVMSVEEEVIVELPPPDSPVQ